MSDAPRAPIPGPRLPRGVETYLRISAPLDRSDDPFMAILGIELRDGDNEEDLSQAVLVQVGMIIHVWPFSDSAAPLARAIADWVSRVYPSRAWFLEVEKGDGTWVQVYYPWALAHAEV